MDRLIVTVTDDRSFAYDMEVPEDVVLEKLKKDILNVLMGYDPALRFDPRAVCLYSVRMEKRLDGSKTLKDAGVWNGDRIQVLSAYAGAVTEG